MGRSPCCVKEGLNKGAWTSQEDKILTEYIKVHGEGKWRNLPKKAGLKRCGKSCRLRWLNYLRPDIKRGNITNDEEDLIIRLHKLLGNRWSLIAGRLPGRTDNEIKNYWNTNIGKRLLVGHHHHPSSSTTGSKPSSSIKSSRAKKNLSKKGSSCVVRTKATRCTKVFIDAELEQTQKPGIMATKEDGIIEKTGLETEAVAMAMAAAKVSKDNSSNFLMDLEMDDKFLYEFFRGEFITSCDLKTRQDSELGSVASLLDPSDLNWLLQDQ